MITADDIVFIVASDTDPVRKIGSIVECRYCRKFEAYEPLEKSNPYDIKHRVPCVWVLSIAYATLNLEYPNNSDLTDK